MLLLPQDDKAKMHSEDNATLMPLTVTRLTRWMRIDAFERDTAVSQKGLDCVLKQSDINAAAIEEVSEEIGKASEVIEPIVPSVPQDDKVKTAIEGKPIVYN
jgi:hypothetical protein